MRNLSSLLNRLTRALDKDSFTKESVIDVVTNLTGAKLTKEDIRIKEGVLEIQTTPGAKNEIRMKEERIKDELRSREVFITRILYK